MLLPNRRRTLLGFGAAFAALLLWWSSIEPSNQRDWQPEVALLPYATRDGERITLHNVRNFDHRTEQDYVARYDERTFDLRELDAVDLIAVYWAGEAIAHVIVSFGFGGEHVAVSIETRKEVGETYSSIAGFFRRYELIYVVGDERDLLGVRTNYREPRELVYLYRTRASPATARGLFLEYVAKINQLREQPIGRRTSRRAFATVCRGPPPGGDDGAATTLRLSDHAAMSQHVPRARASPLVRVPERMR